MKNTDVCSDEGQKADVVCRKLMRKVYEIWRKTYDVRIRVSCFYNDVVLPLSGKKRKMNGGGNQSLTILRNAGKKLMRKKMKSIG